MNDDREKGRRWSIPSVPPPFFNSKKLPVIIRFSVEVDGLPVYNESYDVDKLAAELEEDEAKTLALWARRLKCVVQARSRPGFSAPLTRCLVDRHACDFGSQECTPSDQVGIP